MKNSTQFSKLLFLSLVLICCLASSRLHAQIISNGTTIGTNATSITLVPVSGQGTLLINDGSVVTGPAVNVGFFAAGNYNITNNGVISNTASSFVQAVDTVGPLSFNFVNGRTGVMAINPSSKFEVFRAAQSGPIRTGSLTNYGLIEGTGSEAVVTLSYGSFVVHNEGTIRGGIGFWANNGSLTINQVAGEITSNFSNSIYTASLTNAINVSGGSLTKDLVFDGNNSRSAVNLSGGAINGNLTFNKATSTNTVTVTGGSLNGNVSFGSSLGTITFNRADNYTYSKVISGKGTLVQAGAGKVTLSGTNTYTGGTVIEAGTLILSNDLALGVGAVTLNTANTGTNNTSLLISSAGGTNTLANAITVSNAGTGVSTLGSSELGSGPSWAKFTGAIVLEKDVTLVSAPAVGGDTTHNRTDFRGGISGTGDVTITSAANSRVVFMDKANNFAGNVFISPDSTLQLSDGTTDVNDLIPNAAIVDVGANAFFKVAKGGNPETIGGLTGAGTAQGLSPGDALVLDVAEANSLVFDGPLTGSLALTKTGLGTQTLGGNSSFSGGTTINAGTLVTTTSNALGVGDVELRGGVLALDTGLTIGGNFLWDAAGIVDILDSLSDANNLDIVGDLTLTNGPTNFFDLRGTFVGGSPTKLLTAANMTTNNFNPSLFGIVGSQPGDYFLTIRDGALWIDPEYLIVDGDITATAGTNSYEGVRYISGTDPKLTIPVGSTIGISNNPVVMSNSSITTVDGTFSAPAGFTVQSDSELRGTGTLIGNVINDGRFVPGSTANPTGTTTVQGNFTQGPTGTTGLQVAGTSEFSKALITGTATLAGTLQVTPINGFALPFGSQYQFLTADGGVSGTYSSILMPAGQRGRLLVNGTTASLLVAPQSYTQMALTPNQFNVAQALDNFIGATGDRGTVSAALDGLSASQYPPAFEQMMPSQYSSLPSMAFNVVNALNSSMFQRLWVIRINGRGFSSSGIEMNPMQAEMGGTDDMGVFAINPSKDKKWSSFVDGNGVFANASSTGSVQNYRSQSGGVSTGAAYSWTDAFATGVYVGYQGLQAEYDNGRTIDNAVRFGAFGTYDIEDFYFNALVGVAYHGYTVNRYINFGGLNRTATGRPGAGEFDLALGTGYDFDIGNFSWGPFTTLQYTYLAMQGFTETGADSLNLDVDPYSSSSLLYTLGAQAAYNWKVSDKVVITPTAFAGWQHEFLQNGYTINSTFATGGPAAPFNYNTSSPARDNFYGGVGVTVGVGESWQATFIYSASAANQDNSSQNLYLGLGYKF